MNGGYLRHALSTAFRVARLEKEAAQGFDPTIDGFFRSFAAALVSAPAFVIIAAAQQRIARDIIAANPDLAPQHMAGAGALIAAETIAYVVDWIAFPLLMIPVSQLIDAGKRYVPFITAYNWGSCVLYAIAALAYLLYLVGLVSLEGLAFLVFAATVYGFVFRWRIVRDALRVSPLNAGGVVMLDFLLSLVIAAAAAQLRETL
jgi:hypothetical protein